MKHLITVLCLLGVLVAYFVGWGEGVTALVAIGIILELVFWIRAARTLGEIGSSLNEREPKPR